MKLKITYTDGEYQAGLIYDVPDKKARELIAADKAFQVAEDGVTEGEFEELPEFSQSEKVSKPKKVKHGNG